MKKIQINLNFEFTKGVQSKSEKNTHRMCEIIYMILSQVHSSIKNCRSQKTNKIALN